MRMKQSEQVIPFNAVFSDTTLPMLRLRYSAARQEESITLPKVYCSLQIDANGSTDTKFIALLNVGSSSTVYDQYQFSAYATGITDPDGLDASPTHTQCTTVDAMITAMNAIEGVYAERMHCAGDYSTNTDDFIDTAKTQIGGNPFLSKGSGFLGMYRDVSEIKTLQFRIGQPDCTKYGKVAISGIEYSANGGGSDAITLKFSTDAGGSSDEVVAYGPITIADGTAGQLDWHEEPKIYNGPLLFEVTSDGSLTANDYVTVSYIVVQQ